MWAGLALAQDPDPEPATAKQSTPNAVKKPAAPAEPEFHAYKGSGKIFVKENTWDFGYVAQNTRVTHRFTVQNVGDDTLYITRIKPT